MKNDTTFVRMHSGDHRGDAKGRKKAPCFAEFTFLTNRNRQKRFSQNERRRADLKKSPQLFKYLSQDLVMIFQSLVIFYSV